MRRRRTMSTRRRFSRGSCMRQSEKPTRAVSVQEYNTRVCTSSVNCIYSVCVRAFGSARCKRESPVTSVGLSPGFAERCDQYGAPGTRASAANLPTAMARITLRRAFQIILFIFTAIFFVVVKHLVDRVEATHGDHKVEAPAAPPPPAASNPCASTAVSSLQPLRASPSCRHRIPISTFSRSPTSTAAPRSMSSTRTRPDWRRAFMQSFSTKAAHDWEVVALPGGRLQLVAAEYDATRSLVYELNATGTTLKRRSHCPAGPIAATRIRMPAPTGRARASAHAIRALCTRRARHRAANAITSLGRSSLYSCFLALAAPLRAIYVSRTSRHRQSTHRSVTA